MLCQHCDMDPDILEIKNGICPCQLQDIHVKRARYLCATRCKLCGKLIDES